MLKKLVRDVAIYGSGDFAIKLLSFAVFPIYAHVFTVEQFGMMSLVTTTAGFVAIFLNMGSSHAVQRFYWDPGTKEAERPILVSTGLWMLIAGAVALTSVILLLVYSVRGPILERYGILWIFLLLALASNVPSEILQFSQNVLRLHFAPWRFTVVSACNNLFGVLLGLFFILYLDKGLTGLFLGGFTALTLSVPLGLWLIREELKPRFDTAWAVKLFQFGYPFLFSGLAYWIFGSLDRWMLSELSNNTEVGWYSIAFKLATAMVLVNSAFGQAWSPYAVKVYADDPDYRKVFSRVLSYLFFGLTMAGLGLSLFGREVLMLTTPEPYWNAATALGIVAMSMALAGTQQITGIGISLERRTHLFSVGAWTTAILNFLLNMILIPLWGATGAALATLMSYAALSGMYAYWTQQLHPIPLQKGKLTFSLVVLVLGLTVSAYFNQLTWGTHLLVPKFAVVIAVLAAAFVFKVFPINEIRLALRFREQ
jgi:O-antigen/teichoic acid export membrane protein